MAIRLNFNDQLINLLGSSNIDQAVLKETVQKLPSIPFTVLKTAQPSIQKPDLKTKAEELASRASAVSLSEEKTELLEQAFQCYREFIKSNKKQMFQREIRRVAEDAIFVGADLIDILTDKNKKENLSLAIKKIQIFAGYSNALEKMSLNQPLDALNVPQKHFAVTSNPIGTTNVQDCVFLILRNQKTFSTFAAHVDLNTDKLSTMRAIEQYLPQNVYDAYLIGGHLSLGPDISESDAINSLKASLLLKELSEKGYRFQSRWWILQKNTPINIVYYPKTNEFFEAVPTKELSSYSSREILIYLDKDDKNLLPYFIEQLQCSLHLTSQVQKKLHLLLDDDAKCSKTKIINAIHDDLPSDLRTYTNLKALVIAYSTALQEIFSIVKEKFPNASKDSVIKAFEKTWSCEKNLPLYILPFSREKNDLLITEIQSHL